VEVKLFAEKGELYVLAKSEGRRAKERAMRRKKLARLLWKLRAMRRSCPRRDQLLLRIGGARKEAGSVARFLEVRVPREGEAVTRASFRFRLDKAKLKAAELQDGHYLLRSNLVEEDPAVLWERYIQLTQIEAAFKALKSEMGLRPIYHRLEHRVEAHIFVAFLAYCLLVTLKNRLQALAPGLTPKSGSGKAGRHSNARCLSPDYGRTLSDHAALHAAGTGPSHLVAQTPAQFACSSATTHPGQVQRVSHASLTAVVPTFSMPSLKNKDLHPAAVPYCESQASLSQRDRLNVACKTTKCAAGLLQTACKPERNLKKH
jgi:hypothetical protein